MTALMLFIQVLGLQQLCLCGSCAASKVLAQWIPLLASESPELAEDEHPCCAASRRAAEEEQAKHPSWSSEGTCGCTKNGHVATRLPATVESTAVVKVAPEVALASLEIPWLTPEQRSAEVHSRAVARGPPTLPPEELYLTQKRLLL